MSCVARYHVWRGHGGCRGEGTTSMSETALLHPLVTGYLKQFDADAAILPVHRARELREQIVTHIEEALGRDASDEEISGVLRDLGSTHVLVVDAMATTGKRSWVSRIGLKGWALVGALVLIVAAVSGYYIRIGSIGPLVVQGSAGWWYPQDSSRSVLTEADMATQVTVPIRSGERQGFYVQVFNFTGMTQTVIGSDLENGPAGGTNVQVTASISDGRGSGNDPHAVRYGLPVAIPPGQDRFLRITWISHGCLAGQNIAGMDSVGLRVRVGWTTRTEYIMFNEGFYLGTGGHCAS